MKAADIEISKEGRDPLVKKDPAEPCELEGEVALSDPLSVSGCSACMASRPEEDPHRRQEK